jgi:hypothetical protein
MMSIGRPIANVVEIDAQRIDLPGAFDDRLGQRSAEHLWK